MVSVLAGQFAIVLKYVITCIVFMRSHIDSSEIVMNIDRTNYIANAESVTAVNVTLAVSSISYSLF